MSNHQRATAAIDGEELIELIETDAPTSITMYVPFDRRPTELRACRLALESQLDRVSEQLRTRGRPAGDIEETLHRLTASCPELDEIHPAIRTLAWVARGDRASTFGATERLRPGVAVSEFPAIRPLLAAGARIPRFRVLALSENRVEAWIGDDLGLRPVDVPGLPGSLVDALGTELSGGRALSHRSDRPLPGRAANAAVYHGHGGAARERVIDRERFHRVVGAALTKAWKGSALPVVLAAEERQASELRKHVDLPQLVDEEVRGSPNDLPRDVLHARAVDVTRRELDRRQRALAGRLERAHARGKAIVGDVDAQLEAAAAGRIRRLWVEQDARLPGRVDASRTRRLPPEHEDDDVLDALVETVLRRRGDVSVVPDAQTPTGDASCAELR